MTAPGGTVTVLRPPLRQAVTRPLVELTVADRRTIVACLGRAVVEGDLPRDLAEMMLTVFGSALITAKDRADAFEDLVTWTEREGNAYPEDEFDDWAAMPRDRRREIALERIEDYREDALDRLVGR